MRRISCEDSSIARVSIYETRVLLGGYSSEVPPLPIPNREVKLTHADGTAFCGGRVGSRLFKPNPIRVRLFCVYMCVLFAVGSEMRFIIRVAACGDRENERMRIAGLRCREAAARAVLRTAFSVFVCCSPTAEDVHELWRVAVRRVGAAANCATLRVALFTCVSPSRGRSDFGRRATAATKRKESETF